ncbi:MAG TPA: LptA/OstA family protein [Alphaproteobacteria bacterium]|jgi:lipopolysaccharide export system protein LptA|nr:LptA/OstA family protein [Alphaproteobacteria bacterium]
MAKQRSNLATSFYGLLYWPSKLLLSIPLLIPAYFSTYTLSYGDIFDFGAGNQPTSLEASNGVEIRQQEKIYIARGDVLLKKGTTQIRSAQLIAHYREKEQGGVDIWKIEADGQVVIAGTDYQINSAQAVFNLDQGIFTLEGSLLTIELNKKILTAKEKIVYSRHNQQLIATGAAKINDPDSQLLVTADQLILHLIDSNNGKTVLEQIRAEGNVHIQQRKLRGFSDRMTYHDSSNIANLQGNVRLSDGSNQILGEIAKINTKTQSIVITNSTHTTAPVLVLLSPD